MTLSELYTVLTGCNIPVAYGFFPEDSNVKPPCITYEVAFSENFGADNYVYSPFTNVDIFLFQKTKSGIEATLESKLDAAKIFWDKTETYENDEKVYQTIYEVKINGK